jgi:hypothetical protein
MENNFIEDNICILSKQTMDLLLKQKNPSDLIGLYMFYYYTAKWQQTNQPKCTRPYVMKGLGWGVHKFQASKNKLTELGLISEIIQKNDKGVITGWYIKLNYLWSKDKTNSVETHSFKNELVDNQPPNALSANSLNALSANKCEDIKMSSLDTSFPLKERKRLSNDFIKYFCKRYEEKSGKVYTISNWAKFNTLTQPFIATHGFDDLCQILELYFDYDDVFFRNAKYSLNVFLSDSTINKLIT